MRKLPTKTPNATLCEKALDRWIRRSIRGIALSVFLCLFSFVPSTGGNQAPTETKIVEKVIQELENEASSKAHQLAIAALKQTFIPTRYDPAYVKLDFPMGDVPKNTGVCTDVVIRAYRELGIDLQEQVHVDMKKHFGMYPNIWGLKRPDPNIDHRRVPNLKVFFQRQGASLKVTQDPTYFQVGDLVTSTVPPHLPHIAVVVPSPLGQGNPWIVHNLGRGPRYEDRLFDFPITGHYRWLK